MKTFALILALAAHAFAACSSGFIQITDTLTNPDSTPWNGTISYTLVYDTTVAGATVLGVQQSINIVGGTLSLCLAPGIYAPVNKRSTLNPSVITTSWGVPVSGGPYTVAQIQGTINLQGSFGPVVLSGTPSSGQVPTATSSSTATWQSPSGGSGLLLSATTTITQSQIFNWNTTPITLLPAAPAGTVYFPWYIVLQAKGNATYACNTGACNLLIKLGSNTLSTWNVINDIGGFNTLLVALSTITGSQWNGESSGFTAQALTSQMTDAITGSGGNITLTVYYLELALP